SSPYAVSKVLTENQATYYSGRGLECIVARPFNHIGPGQGKGFILPDFYGRLNETIKGDVIKVGNINTKRDYTDVRDIVKAYTALILAPALQHSVYNVCSGKSLAGSEVLDMLKKSMKKDSIQFEVDPDLIRPTDIPEIVGDSTRLREELQWQPGYDISQTINDFVQDMEN
ncbi:NAD-dependent epimerase/dehydratase family protein, partial [archaeon]